MAVGSKKIKEYRISFDKREEVIRLPADNVKAEISFTDFPALRNPQSRKSFFPTKHFADSRELASLA